MTDQVVMQIAGAALSHASFAGVSFSSSILFDVDRIMPRQQVTSGIAFTPSEVSAVAGMQCLASLVADGVNIPTFTGFKEAGWSAGYLNTAGIVNNIEFLFDGLDYLFAVLQNVNPVTAPVCSQITAAATGTTVVLGYSKSLSGSSVPPTSAFAIINSAGAQNVTGVAVSGTGVTLTTDRVIGSTDTITVSYIPPPSSGIKSTDGEFAGALTNFATTVTGGPPVNTVAPALSSTTPVVGIALSVSNGTWTNSPTSYGYQWKWADTGAAISGATSASYTPVTGDISHTLKCDVTATNASGSATTSSNTSSAVAAAPANTNIRLTIVNGLSETVDGSGYDYGPAADSSSNTFTTNLSGVTSTKLASGSDGYAGATFTGYSASVDGLIVGFKATQATGTYVTVNYGIYCTSGTSHYVIINNGTGGVAPTTNITPAANDIVRMHRVGTTITAEVSKDSGSTWTVAYTWTSVSAADLYGYFDTNKPRGIKLPFTNGFA